MPHSLTFCTEVFDPQLSLMREGRAYSRVCRIKPGDEFMAMFVFMHILLAFKNVILRGFCFGN